MKNIFKIHPLTYLLILICSLSGRFKIIILYMSLIIFHELGHMLTGLLFNWKIDKIYIYPLGGLTKFNDRVNRPLSQELLVTIAGPIFQVILSIIIKKYDNNILLYSNYLLFFNLLPIVPLDGGRIISIIFFLFKPLKKSLNLIIKISYLSYFVLLFFLIKNHSLFFLLVVFFLIFKINSESIKKDYYYDKYLLEKYLFIIKYRRNQIIYNIKNVYKYRNNYIKVNNRLYSEQEYIRKIINTKNNCK